MKVLVTGGAGYIGSHVAWELVDAGHEVTILDNLTTGVRENMPPQARFVEGDVGDPEAVDDALDGVEAVLHFAANIVVPESVADPLKYYHNNTVRVHNLLSRCVEAGVDKIVFSSTAAVYGTPEEIPVRETTPLDPINPYGRSKMFTEGMIRDVSYAHGIRHVILRYFNVAGADPKGRTGQSTPAATHLIKVACQVALGQRERIEIYGTDFPTHDGTGVRDYIHVTDLAKAHLLALDHLSGGGDSATLNCGYGHGYSVREVIDAVREVSGVDFEAREVGRRAGDPAALTADSSALKGLLAWEPDHDDLHFMVRTALDWERREGTSD